MLSLGKASVAFLSIHALLLQPLLAAPINETDSTLSLDEETNGPRTRSLLSTKDRPKILPPIPEDILTGKKVEFSEEDRRKEQEEMEKLDEQECEDLKDDKTEYIKYQYEYKGQDGHITTRYLVTGGTMGQGGFATVYEAYVEPGGREKDFGAVVKSPDPKKPQHRGMLFVGAGIQRELARKTKLVVREEGFFLEPDTGKAFLVMPVYFEGELTERLLDVYSQGQAAVNKLFLKALEAVKVMHGEDIMHRDLKPSNFLMDGQQVLLTDFDMATHSTGDDSVEFGVGSPPYIAPEIIRRQKYGKKSDVFSMGIMLAWMSFPNLWEDSAWVPFWKDLVEWRGHDSFSTPEDVVEVLDLWFEALYKKHNILHIYHEVRDLLKDVLCGPEDRIDAKEFYSRLKDLVGDARN
ncbi:serine threonine kinase [Penicillium capsulatum]|uniref:Serine threonine kinase n=1 Tax=Penicillium capsulatum TaxID=69766 RepID=A0A9W9HTZ9_9EURO|nr:serine threonine kinase [Penicillium capsulatum]KAJ6106526.1 serine threonine kinase [Penicillium capsulatum]